MVTGAVPLLTGDGDADVLDFGRAEGVGVGDSLCRGVADGEGVGVSSGGDGETEGSGVPVGVGDGVRLATGVGAGDPFGRGELLCRGAGVGVGVFFFELVFLFRAGAGVGVAVRKSFTRPRNESFDAARKSVCVPQAIRNNSSKRTNDFMDSGKPRRRAPSELPDSSESPPRGFPPGNSR